MGNEILTKIGDKAEWCPAPKQDQVQADWNVTDSTSQAFIKNKPFGDVPGVQVFSSYSPSNIGNDDEGNQVFTFTDNKSCEIAGRLTNIMIGGKIYENIPTTTTQINSSAWTVTFDTTGLPFIVSLGSSNNEGTNVVVTSLDGSYISYITIKDMSQKEKVKLSSEYINTSELGRIFPMCSNMSYVKDKMHLVYQDSNDTFLPTFDVYLKSNSNKIFRLNVDDSGTISAIEVT